MIGFAVVPDPAVSFVRGMPLADEPGLGSLTLSGFIREVTQRYAAHEAIAQPQPDGTVERWSYADLWSRSMAVAQALIASGVDKGARVGVLMTNRAEFVVSAFGIALAGGVVTAFSTFSTAAELDILLTESCCSILLLEPQVLKKDFSTIVASLCPESKQGEPGDIRSVRYPFLRHVISLDRNAADGAVEPWPAFLARGTHIDQDMVMTRAQGVQPADPGVLLFSSGSTGKPKGILSAQRAVCIQMWRWGRIFAIRERDRILTANGFFWSGQFGMAIGGALSSGGTLVMQSVFKPEATLALYASERVTVPMAWPHQWEQLAGAANWNEVDLSSLHHVGQSSPLRGHPTVHTNWDEPTRCYGNTETFTLSSAYASGTPEKILRGSYGFPLPGMTIKIVDPFTGATMPTGQRGEIAVKGATLMLGYVGIPLDETLDNDGFFRTGDGGYVDADGRFYWEGRLNDIIKTGGANVSPVEVDTRLLQHPAIKLTQTVGVPHDTLGELVVACVVLHDGATLDEATARAFSAEYLASYKVPRRVLFMAESDFVQTGSAKVKTSEMRALAAKRLGQ